MRTGLKALAALVLLVLIGLAVWEPMAATRYAAPAPLKHDARIVRDSFGVPHIFGKTDADTAFGLAYSKASYVGPWIASILALDLKSDPALAKAQALLAGWDWASDGKGSADALAEILVRDANSANYAGRPLPDPKEAFVKAVARLQDNFGRVDVPLGDIQRLRRGSVDLPMDGGTDALRATSRWDKETAKGRGRVMHGDSFIMLVTWDKAGRVESRSIQPYGAATNRPDSPHYTDQMKLFVDRKFKPVHFDRAALVANAKRAYRVN